MRERTSPLPGYAATAVDIQSSIEVDRAGCWLWQRYIKPNGYGQFVRPVERTRYVHRIAYMTWKGSIPEGLEIDHLCRVRHCCNPEHLEAVAAKVNMYRSENFTATYARTESCPEGHPYDEENTYIRPRNGGGRDCRKCRTEASRRMRNALPNQFRDTPVEERKILFPLTRTECRQGHRLVEDNIYVDTWGKPHCRECRSAATRRSALNRAKVA